MADNREKWSSIQSITHFCKVEVKMRLFGDTEMVDETHLHKAPRENFFVDDIKALICGSDNFNNGDIMFGIWNRIAQ